MVYQTEPLETELRVAGPQKITLYVSTSGTDSDWVVKLIDVYPSDFPDTEPPAVRAGQTQVSTDRVVRMGGYQQLVRGEPFRGKFRHSFSKPEPFTPGKVEKMNLNCQMCITHFGGAIASWCTSRAPGFRWWIGTLRSS